jgi:pilus assembly protein CpaE
VIRIVLAVNDARLADHLSGLAAESDEFEVATTLRDPQELRGALPRPDVDAVVVHDRRGAVPLIEITRELTVAHPDLGLVLIVAENSPEVLRSGMQAGARDVIAEPIGLEQLETSVLAAAAWTQALRRRAARDAHGELVGLGRVVTVVGAKGGVGTTTVAVHLALAARDLGEASVCLVEYDLQAGDLRAFLDLPYRRSVVDLAAVADELTARHLQETLYTHATGMRVLLAPLEGEQSEMVSAAAARNILTAIRTREDLTIVDAGTALTEASAIAAEMADTVLIVTTPDVVSLRGVSRLCSQWERLKVEPPEVAVLLNRTSRRLEVPPDLARRVVPVPVLQTTVPADFFALESAINTGIPAAGAASETMLRPMAGVLGEISALRPSTPEETETSAAKRIAARFAGESGQAAVEFAGVLPLALIVLVALWQIVLIGMTVVFAGHAARAGARALAVGDPVKPAAVGEIPSAWRGGAVVSPTTDNRGGGHVDVQIKLPLLLPGTLSLPISIPSSAGTVIEDQLIAGEQGWSLDSPTTAGQPAIFGPQLLSSPYFRYAPGNVPVLDPTTGFLEAPRNAPVQVREMIAAANEIRDFPYPEPVEHFDGQDLTNLWPAYDCSGATSFVLHAAKLIGPATDSTGLESWGVPGQGNWVTVYTNPAHAHIVIDGFNFDTAAGQGMPPNPPASGPRWTTTTTDAGTFQARTWPGL